MECYSTVEELRLSQPHTGEILVVLAKQSLSARISPGILSIGEHERFRRFRSPSDQERFLVAHGLKRLLLSRLTGNAPAQLHFETMAHGKPVLSGAELHFSLSHSGNWIALALASGAPVGADVEQPHADLGGLLAAPLFHPGDEISPHSSENERFLTAWTLKEAVSKCIGLGLNLPFPSICLRRKTSHYEASTCGTTLWAKHTRLPDGAHLSLASSARCTVRALSIV